MNNFYRAVLSLLVGLSLTFTAYAGPTAGAPLFPFKDLQKGMKGVGYTTFEGIEPEAFDVEIKGFNYNMMGPGQHIIIALLTGPKIEFTSTIAGMSGSPVYIDGKLVGAVSLSLSKFPKEVLVGITPIESMLKAGQSAGSPLLTASQEKELAAQGLQVMPLKQLMPTVKGGKNTHNRTFLLDSQSRTRDIKKLLPGGPIATFMTIGDVEMAAIGTITDIRDGVVYAFGHPFEGQGHVNIPFGSAEVVRVVANEMLSYKMANAGPVLGTIVEDRSPAIVGKIGQMPDLIPVKMVFERPEGSEEYNFSIVRDTQNSSAYLQKALLSILTEEVDYNRGGTLRVESTVKLVGKEPLHFVDMVSMETNANFLGIEITPYNIASQLGAENFDNFWAPPLGKMAVESLTYTYKYSPEIRELKMKKLEVERVRLKAGEKTMAHLELWLPDGQIMKKDLEVEIPADCRPGKVTLQFSGAAKVETLPVLFTNLDNYYQLLQQLRPDGYLYSQLIGTGASVSLGAVSHYNLPGNFAMLARGEDGPISKKAVLWEKREPLDYVIKGEIAAEITVY